MNKEFFTVYLPVILSVVSFIISVWGYNHSRKTFIFSVATERAKAVIETWKNTPKTDVNLYVSDHYVGLWSPVVSDIVASINIINKLAEKVPILRMFYNINDFYIVFWEQIPTDLRTAIEGYNSNGIKADEDDINVFRKQMEVMLKTYTK